MNHFKTVKFVNLSVSALGVFDQESSPFFEMLKELNVDNNYQKYVIREIINIAIRSTYYITFAYITFLSEICNRLGPSLICMGNNAFIISLMSYKS